MTNKIHEELLQLAVGTDMLAVKAQALVARMPPKSPARIELNKRIEDFLRFSVKAKAEAKQLRMKEAEAEAKNAPDE